MGVARHRGQHGKPRPRSRAGRIWGFGVPGRVAAQAGARPPCVSLMPPYVSLIPPCEPDPRAPNSREPGGREGKRVLGRGSAQSLGFSEWRRGQASGVDADGGFEGVDSAGGLPGGPRSEHEREDTPGLLGAWAGRGLARRRPGLAASRLGAEAHAARGRFGGGDGAGGCGQETPGGIRASGATQGGGCWVRPGRGTRTQVGGQGLGEAGTRRREMALGSSCKPA